MSKRLVSLVSSFAFLLAAPMTAATPGCGSEVGGTAWLAALVTPLPAPLVPATAEPGRIPLGCVDGLAYWIPTGFCCNDITEQQKHICQGSVLVPQDQYRCRPPACS